MRHALYLPPFGELADVRALAEIAATAEAAGWDGVFVWDHLLRAEPGAEDVADTTVALAAVALATERVRFGPMVTPISRRRPQKLAREIITLDHLSGGRLVWGFGLGVDTERELSGFGEITDARTRAQMLDEGAAVLDALVSGRAVDHLGPHYVADGVTYRPHPVQRPRPPFWFAARRGHPKPVARAARYDGLFAIELTADQLARDLDVVAAIRGGRDGFDVAVTAHGNDLAAFAAAGVTWVMWDYPPGVALAEVLGDARNGPPA